MTVAGDRPPIEDAMDRMLTTVSPRGWWMAVLYIAAVALLLRFYDLPLKPLHHDEGVNTLLLTRLVQPPHAYKYDPGNYHGPTLFYFAWLSASVAGLTTVAIRLVTAIAGLATVLMLLAFRRHIGAAGALAAAAALAVSSGAVYYSRYFIHETLLVCFTLAAVLFAILWWHERRRTYLYLAAASGGLMFATKETAIISAVVIVAAAVGSPLLADVATALAGGERRQLLSAVARGMTRRNAALPAALRDRGGVRVLVEAAAVFVAVALLFYTSFFSDREGALAAVRTFAIWSKTGTTAHTHPWYSYISWLRIEELPLLVAGTAGAALALLRPGDRFATFAALWSVGILTAYSLIPYKTPWLVLNAIVPLALCAGYAFERLWRYRGRAWRVTGWVVLAVALGVGASRAAWLSFWHYDDDSSPYVYAHTSRELLKLVETIDQIEAANPGAAIAVTSAAHFPLSWYLRGYTVGFHGRVFEPRSPIVIASLDQQTVMDLLLAERFERTGPYRLRPGVRLFLYVRRDLKRPPAPPS